MEFTNKRTVQVIAFLLLVLVVTQIVYTALFYYGPGSNAPWRLLWGFEALLFTILTAFSGAAMLQTGRYQLGWSAVTFSAVLNLIQVSVGGTLILTFRESAGEIEALAPAAGGIVALAFMVYYTAKFLLGFAALVFGMAKRNEGAKALGSLTAIAGAVTMGANAILIVFGQDGFLPSSVATVPGVAATLLLALCLLSVAREGREE
ncbi:MAG: thiamine biosynthesis protein ThiC [Pseudomonadota bacterium]